jgi:hypothetical protein
MLALEIAMSLTSLSKRSYFFRDAFRLRDELLALRFTFSLGGGGSGVLGWGKSLDRSLWKISFACLTRWLTTFGSPFLSSPSLQGLLR